MHSAGILVTELETVIDDVSAMEDGRVVIFTGDGDKAFVAGGDIKEMYVMNPEKGVAYSKLGTRVLYKIEKHAPAYHRSSQWLRTRRRH